MQSSRPAHEARVYQLMGRTKEAVDAASSAIVSWGRRHGQRTTSIAHLKQIFVNAKDRDDYAKYLDSEAKKTGQIVRSFVTHSEKRINS